MPGVWLSCEKCAMGKSGCAPIAAQSSQHPSANLGRRTSADFIAVVSRPVVNGLVSADALVLAPNSYKRLNLFYTFSYDCDVPV
jgi:hypothetical protein